MSKQFVPLTAEQLASAEKGYLKLEYRNGGKVMQLVRFRSTVDQRFAPIRTVNEKGIVHKHELCGCDSEWMSGSRDLFVCEVQPVKYGGQLTGVPVEIVEFMLDQQEAQGNKRDASVFERNFADGVLTGGFDWGYAGRFDDMYAANDGNYKPMLEYLKKRKSDETPV